jgi:hypothetical protein
VLLGNGNGTFQAAQVYYSGGQIATSIAVGDVNGDGKPDVLVANLCISCFNSNSGDEGIVGVLLGNGDGTFQAARSYDSGGYGALGIAVGDVSGDGKADLLVANACAGSETCWNGPGVVGVLLGNGDGTFQPPQSHASGGFQPYSIAVGDVNADGKFDLLVTNCGSISCADGGVVSVLLGNGDGTFQTAQSYGSGGTWAHSVALGDVNGDGKPDLLVANWCTRGNDCDNNTSGDGVVGVLLGNGDGTFQSAANYDSGGYGAGSVAVGDVNGDSKPDLLVVNLCHTYDVCPEGVAGVLLGNGDGTFQNAQQYHSGGNHARAIAVADVNGDGKPDLLTANLCALDQGCNHSGVVGVLLNNSGSHSATVTTLVSSQNPSPVGQPVTFTATVKSENGGVVTGTVTFKYGGGRTMAQVTLVDGQAAYTLLPKNNGVHVITATYSGDTQNEGSTSPVLYQYVKLFPVKTVLQLSASPSPSLVGEPVTFTAKVTSIFGKIPDGELVTFYDGTATLGSVTLAGGVATYTTSSLAAGSHFIKATYAGDPIFRTCSRHLWQVVNQAGSR